MALVPFCAGVFPCSVALVFRFWACNPLVQHGLREGVRNMYKTNAILPILKADGKRRMRQEADAKEQYLQYSLEK
jgi:hypothetical protein